MNIGDSLGCKPTYGIANLTNIAFANLRQNAHAGNVFGFYQCQYCNKTILGNSLALQYMVDFWVYHATTFYTVCR